MRRSAAVLALLAPFALSAPLAAQAGTPLRSLDEPQEPWRTVRSGEGFRATVFGSELVIPPRDRNSVTSVEGGIAVVPGADNADLQPNASLYLWRSDSEHLLRAVLAGVYNEVLWASSYDGERENVLTFVNDTAPWAVSERIDGVAQDREQLAWGYVRSGFGTGIRRRIGPQPDNQFAADLILEPGLLWFARGDRTDPAFEMPDTTFELRLRAQVRLDQLERNLIELPHAGHALGADLVNGWRSRWNDWGLPGVETHDASSGNDYVLGTAYALWVGAVPGDDSERDRVIASLHAGAGSGVDRFSAQRIGGGPDRRGEEFDTTAMPLLPGAVHGEFFPDHYAIGALGYRREVTFFAFVQIDGTVAWLDRDRETATGRERENDWLTAADLRLFSGCYGSTRFQLGYAYGFDTIRDGSRGGGEFIVQVTGRF
jgi:hypothetical protein